MNVSVEQTKPTALPVRLACVLKAFLRQPSQVATIAPSSRHLIDAVTQKDCVRQATTVVELGPGAGGTTSGLLANMGPNATLLAIEKTAEFDGVLQQLADPRLRIEIGDALYLLEHLEKQNLGKADVVVSGIPFSAIPRFAAKRLVQSIYESLNEGGTFIAYQLQNDVQKYAQPLFGPAETKLVLWNVPPLRVYTWTKVAQSPLAPSSALAPSPTAN